MRYWILFIFVAGCKNNDDGFRKMENGLELKIISSGTGAVALPGQVFKMQVRQLYGDSVLSDTHSSFPQYQLYDMKEMSGDAWKIFAMLRNGDSVIFRVDKDSAFARSHPTLVRTGKKLITYVKILDLLMNADSARIDYEREKVIRLSQKK